MNQSSTLRSQAAVASSLETLPTVLAARMATSPNKVAYRFLRDEDAEPTELSYRQLYQRASDVAHQLRARTARGARVLIMCPPGLDYVTAIWACLLAERVAVPSLPPRLNRSSTRFEALLADTLAGAALITTPLSPLLGAELRAYGEDSLDLIEVDGAPQVDELVYSSAEPDDLAVLQYTSGSTSTPRGVMLSHANLLENVQRSIEGIEADAESRLVSWLPPYHDMGLIGVILLSVVAGCEATMMSPASFITHPHRWLEALSRYRGTHSGGPNFAYALCVRRVGAERRQGLNLAHWRVAWNGAERVRSETIDAFCEAFSDAGFRRHTMRPCYGLAEATLAVSMSDSEGAVTFAASQQALARHQVVAAETADDTVVLTGSGKVLPKHRVCIVDAATGRALEPNMVGEIWVRGPSVPTGYFQRPHDTERVFRARLSDDFEAGGSTREQGDQSTWLRTGDLGFLRAGHLYVTGRLKDLLIVRGSNFYPDDLETTAQSAHPALRPHCGAAFSVDVDGEERVCLVQEVDAAGSAHEDDHAWERVGSLLRAAILAEHDLVLHDVWLVRPGQVPKTSSGKVQRSLARRRYLEGEFEAVLRQTDAGVSPARRSKYEDAVARECMNLLGLQSIERDDDLFRLGAQSVVALQLAARLEQVLSRRLSLRALFEARTVARLAAVLEEAEASETLPAIEPVEGASRFPLSLAQERMWFEHAFDPGSSAYNIAGALVLRGSCQEAVLGEVVDTLVARHAALRARFSYTESGLSQETLPPASHPFSTTDLPTLADAQTHAERLAHLPFDLSRDSVLRAHLFRVNPELRVLVLVVHHIACDGLSMDILVDEMSSLYEALAGRVEAGGSTRDPRRAALAQLSITYPDFAAWQRRVLGHAPLEKSVQYWKDKLQGVPVLSTFPADHSRPARRTLEGRLVKRVLPPTLLTALDSFCQELGVTRYMTLLSAFNVLLMRYSGEQDLCIGTPVSGRNHAQTESLVGTFVNMLVMRTQVPPELSFVELVSRVRDTALDAFEHQAAPFERVVEALAPARSQAHTPIFQVMFDYQAMRHLRRHVASMELEPLLLNRGASQYDLGLSVLEAGGQTILHLEYRTDLFEHESALRIADRFVALLESALLEPHASCGRLPWLLPLEHEELLARGRGPLRAQSGSGVFLDDFEMWAARRPHAVAASDERLEMSYALLEARANRLAHRLRGAGVGPDVPVAVYLERGIELLVALLGVLKAGGAYVPLDPVYPSARIALMLEDASPPVLITERALLASLPPRRGMTLVMEDERAALAGLPSDAPHRGHLQPQHLAYIIFTSGSTGRPKGVEVTHAALQNLLASMAREPGLSDGDSLLAVTTVSFDIAALELFLPLYVGARVEVATRRLAADGPALVRRLARGDVTCVQATPATFRMLLEAGLAHHPSLKLLCGGEALTKDLAEALSERAGGGLFNVYGPTETTIWSACGQIENGPVALGRPIDNTFLYVLDDGGVPVPQGVAGELFIGGQGVARGYHRRPDLTAERFVLDPFVQVEPRAEVWVSSGLERRARMYRTGDRVRFRHDGELEFLGRIDQQIKIRGYRVELGEIESQILVLPGIEACAVKVFALSPQDARLVAYIVRRQGEGLARGDMQAALRGHLPEYMVPSVYVELPALPLTPNGKVDRKALLIPRFEDEASRPFDPPRDELERAVCGLFEDVLGRKPVGLNDSFFDLGGHSILAVRLFERLTVQTGQRLPLSTLFEAPTPLELSLLIRAEDKTRERSTGSYVVSLVDTGQSPHVFCVHPDGSGTRQALDWYHPLLGSLGTAAAAVSCDEDVYLEFSELAARHVSALRKQPLPRSICLVGVGFGGNLAQEIAVQLEDAGIEVKRVVIIQSTVPNAGGGVSLGYVRSLPLNVRRAVRGFLALRHDEAKSRQLLWARKVRRFLKRKGNQPPALEEPVDLAALPACYQSLSAPQYNALLRHQGRPCAAPLTLVRAHRSGLTPLDEAHGFAALSFAAVDVRILDCSAEALLDHQVDGPLNVVLREILASDAQELAWRPLLALSN